MIVVELSGDRIRVADVVGANGQASLNRSISEELPKALSVSSAAELAAWLKQKTLEASIRPGDAICVLGRGYVTLKALQVPVVPDNELPGVVLFAVEGATHEAGSIVVDFYPGPIQAGAGDQPDEQEILAAVASTETLDAVRAVLAKAGFTARRIIARPYAVRSAIPQAVVADDESVGVVYISTDTLEVSLWTGEHLRICRWVSVGPSVSEERMVNEVLRTIAVFHSGAAISEIQRVVVLGEDAPSLLSPLRAGLSSDVQLAPTAMPIDFLPLIGAGATAGSKAPWPIDLAHPKKAKSTAARWSKNLVLASILAAVLVVGGGSTIARAFWSRDARIRDLQEELSRLDQSIAAIAPPEKRYAATKRWVESADPILDELQEIALALPDTSELFVTSLEYRAGFEPQPGSIRIDGLARAQPVVTRAQERLARESKGRWKVTPNNFAPTGDVAPFDWQWGLELSMEQSLAPAAYSERLPERQKGVEALDPGQGQARNDLRLTKKSGSGQAARSNASRSGRPSRPSSSAESESDSTRFFDEKVESIRKLPQEQWEEAIQQEPRFMQKRLRKALETKEGS